MSNSYITFYQNEVRAIELVILDQDDVSWVPTTAYYTVINELERIIVSLEPAQVTSTGVSALISTNVTETPGTYVVQWKLVKDSYIYYHKTTLIVNEL